MSKHKDVEEMLLADALATAIDETKMNYKLRRLLMHSLILNIILAIMLVVITFK